MLAGFEGREMTVGVAKQEMTESDGRCVSAFPRGRWGNEGVGEVADV